jgi:hypothetical protein
MGRHVIKVTPEKITILVTQGKWNTGREIYSVVLGQFRLGPGFSFQAFSVKERFPCTLVYDLQVSYPVHEGLSFIDGFLETEQSQGWVEGSDP